MPSPSFVVEVLSNSHGIFIFLKIRSSSSSSVSASSTGTSRDLSLSVLKTFGCSATLSFPGDDLESLNVPSYYEPT